MVQINKYYNKSILICLICKDFKISCCTQKLKTLIISVFERNYNSFGWDILVLVLILTYNCFCLTIFLALKQIIQYKMTTEYNTLSMLYFNF